MNGRNSARLSPPAYSPSGSMLEVVTNTKPRSNSWVNRRPRDHGVGYVVHVKFVEAQKPCLGGEGLGDGRDRVVALDLAGLQLLAPVLDALVHVGHEVVEMGAALPLQLGRLIEQVDEHGFAAADLAPDVEPFQRGFLLAAGEQPAQMRLLFGQPPVDELGRQPCQPVGDLRLTGIEGDLAALGHARIAFGDRAAHAGPRRIKAGVGQGLAWETFSIHQSQGQPLTSDAGAHRPF